MTIAPRGPAPLRAVHTNPAIRARHLAVAPAHDHSWALREVEYDDHGATLHRYECPCGDVNYR